MFKALFCLVIAVVCLPAFAHAQRDFFDAMNNPNILNDAVRNAAIMQDMKIKQQQLEMQKEQFEMQQRQQQLDAQIQQLDIQKVNDFIAQERERVFNEAFTKGYEKGHAEAFVEARSIIEKELPNFAKKVADDIAKKIYTETDRNVLQGWHKEYKERYDLDRGDYSAKAIVSLVNQRISELPRRK